MANAPGAVDTSYCGDSLMGVSIAIAVLQVLIVILRFYARSVQRVALASDDYLILLALVGLFLVPGVFFQSPVANVVQIASLGQSSLYIVCTCSCSRSKQAPTNSHTVLQVAGLGYHLEYVLQTPEKLVALQKGLVANQVLDFPFTVTPAKISILLFYARIFTTTNFRILAGMAGAIVLAHGISVFFAAIFQCLPVQYAWDKNIPGGSCFDQQAFYRYVSPPNILTDVLILIMPLPFVWRLHTRLTQKIALTGVFLLGGL